MNILFKKTIQLDRSNQLDLIEKAARVCYKSKIKDKGTQVRFLSKRLQEKHMSIFRHGAYTVLINIFQYIYLLFRIKNIDNARYFKFSIRGFKVVMSSNFQAYYEFGKKYNIRFFNKLLSTFAHREKNFLFNDWRGYKPYKAMPKVRLKGEEIEKHTYLTYKLITNRGVTHELVRHTTLAFSQESTRYVNYKKKGLAFIRPEGFYRIASGKYTKENTPSAKKMHHLEKREKIWLYSMFDHEENYLKLLEEMKQPQIARGLLPIDVKTIIVFTGNIEDIKEMCKQRTSTKAHPDIQHHANKIQIDVNRINNQLK